MRQPALRLCSGAENKILVSGKRRRDPVGQDGIILQIRDLDHRHDAVLAVVHQKVRLRGVLERQNLDGALVDVVVGDARLDADAFVVFFYLCGGGFSCCFVGIV